MLIYHIVALTYIDWLIIYVWFVPVTAPVPKSTVSKATQKATSSTSQLTRIPLAASSPVSKKPVVITSPKMPQKWKPPSKVLFHVCVSKIWTLT